MNLPVIMDAERKRGEKPQDFSSREPPVSSAERSEISLIVILSEHKVSFSLDQFNRLSREILSVMSDDSRHICTFVDEVDQLLVRHADGYYADEWGFRYDALYYAELDDGGREIARSPANRVIPVK